MILVEILLVLLLTSPECLARMRVTHAKHVHVLSPLFPSLIVHEPIPVSSQQTPNQPYTSQAVQRNFSLPPPTSTQYIKNYVENIKKTIFGWWSSPTAAANLSGNASEYPRDETIKPINTMPTQGNMVGPLPSTNCFSYKPGSINIEDWDNAANLGWIARSELSIPRISLVEPVYPQNPKSLVLKNLRCNAASYTGKINLASESCAGLVFRSSGSANPDFMAVELNTLTKSIALKHFFNGTFTLIDERTDDIIQPQLLETIKIIDYGNDGRVEVELNDKPLLSAVGVPYYETGSFGPWQCQGSAMFSELSSEGK